MSNANNSYPWPNGCDTSKPLTNPYEDADSRCNHCRWFLNRCHPSGPCDPARLQSEDNAVWSY